MTLTIILVCAAVLLALGPFAVALGRSSAATRLVYGASMLASAVSLAAAIAHLLGAAAPESITLPVGVPEPGALATTLKWMTTAWPTNKRTPGGPGAGYPDVNLNSERERFGGPTFAAITSRSYHPGGVNALLGDGSVRFIKNSISWPAWRGLGTIAGGEVISSDAY